MTNEVVHAVQGVSRLVRPGKSSQSLASQVNGAAFLLLDSNVT